VHTSDKSIPRRQKPKNKPKTAHPQSQKQSSLSVGYSQTLLDLNLQRTRAHGGLGEGEQRKTGLRAKEKNTA
jgi:hypothetical protein